MNPILRNAPLICRADDAWRRNVEVRYPYMGMDEAAPTVPSLEPAIAIQAPSRALELVRSFALGETQRVPPTALGWGSADEELYRTKLRELATQARYYAKGPSAKARKQINDLGARAQAILNTSINDFYTKDWRRGPGGQPLDQEYVWEPGNEFPDETRRLRNELRHAIIDAYREAAQVLWCALYGAAEIDAYLDNKARFEAQKPPPDPTKLSVDPFWDNYEPIEYDDAGWQIANISAVTLPGAELDGQFTEDEDETGSGLAILGVLGAAAAFFYLTRGRR